jgi:hypothetical protein
MKDTLKNLLIPIAKPLLSRIHRYKDAHKGESCYLMGDGISIKWFDLAAFSDKTTIPCGFIPFHNEFDCLNVNYLSLIEPWWFYPFQWTTSPPIEVIRNHIHKVYTEDVIDQNHNKKFFVNLSNFPTLRRKNIIYNYSYFLDDRLPANYLSRRINSYKGSLNWMILLATYLGFDHVYLVGCDYTHLHCRSLHWYEKGRGIDTLLPSYQKEFFEIAQEFIDITTITLDGASEFINAVTYKEHTGREPMFRENTELLNEKYLQVLATWPGYTIF